MRGFMRLRNKVAIVTGGSQGIGEAIARRYAQEGAHVAIVYNSNDQASARVAGAWQCRNAAEQSPPWSRA